MKDNSTWAYAFAIVGGALLWLGTSAVTGKNEAWDASLYWTATYPIAVVLAGALGFWAPKRAWRWGLAVMVAQALVLMITAEGFGLLPVGLIFFAVLSLPAIGLAVLLAKIRLRSARA